jgi:uncharacterized membrane protein YccF (DUF307 family)
MRVYSFAAALIGWTCLLVQYIGDGNFQSVAQTVSYLSYFSILSNILVALTLTTAAVLPSGHWLTRPFAATAIALYISVTGLPFAFRSLADLQGWQLAADIGLHRVMPISFLLFWVVFVPKGTLALHHSFAWMIFPTIYLIYLLLCGPCYAFLDIRILGFHRLLGNIGLTVVAFWGLGQSLAVIDRLCGRSQQSALSNADARWRSC